MSNRYHNIIQNIRHQTPIALMILIMFVAVSCNYEHVPQYIKDLDDALDNTSTFLRQKEYTISILKNKLSCSKSPEERYHTNIELYQNYQYFSLDSAFVFIKNAEMIADSMGNDNYIQDVRISHAFLYNFAGMTSEARNIFEDIDISDLSHDLKRNYFYLGFNLYNTLSEQALEPSLCNSYKSKMKLYRDSAITYSTGDLVLESERLSDERRYDEAISMIAHGLPDGLVSNEAGLKYYILSEIYERLGNEEQQTKYLALSSIASIHNSVRQYIALRKLAMILYRNGDTERAYRYIHACLEDAKACNSHERLLETSKILPIIDSSMIDQKQSHRNVLIVTIGIISGLVVLLLIGMYILHKRNYILNQTKLEQVKTNENLQIVNEQLKRANEQLTQLNSEILQANNKQKQLNIILEETNNIKDVYIKRFMNLCLEYIGKMENYRKHLCKVASKRNFDALYETIQSSRYINKEIADFYANFDDAFLHIYPNFVTDFNKLLKPQSKIVLKKGERLNTELRIYALLKLGITEGGRITEFLRCSASTIYNYRTNMRNKAINRDSFEVDVQSLGE